MKKTIITMTLAMSLCVAMLCACGSKEEQEPATESAVMETEPTPTPTPLLVSDGTGGTMWIEPAEDLEPFQLDLTQFSQDGDEISYTGEGYDLKRGIDVSAYQKEIDWQAVAADGIEFAIIRCAWRGYSGGTLNEDEYFAQNVQGALDAGLEVGVYVFSQAINAEEGVEEAEMALAMMDGYDITLPVFFDWEHIDGDTARTDDVDGDTLTDAALAFCDTITAAGYDAGVYSYLTLYYNDYDLDSLSEMYLWAADPGMWPEFYYDHDYWQYSFTGSVDGIEGDTDLDVLFVRTDDNTTVVTEGAQG